MTWLVGGIVLIITLLLGVQLIALLSARRIKGKRPADLGGSLGASVASGRPVLAYFFSPSCPACVRQAPIVQRLQQEYPDIFTINVPENIETARKLGVMGTPSIVFIRDGLVKEFLLGYQPEARLRSLISS